MRVLSGTFAHETSTFTPVATTWESYRERVGYLTGEEIFDKFRGTNSIIGGYLDGAETHGFELIPTVCAHAYPSGPTPREIFDTILNDILERMAAAGKVDGVLLELHGAMVAEGVDDGEGHILAAVRKLVGPDVPILAELDIHANVSQQMVEMADVLIGRKTFPEIDQAERARQCADVLMRMANEGLRPTMALCSLPMVWGAKQVTAHQPMKEVIDRLYRIEASPGVVCASLPPFRWRTYRAWELRCMWPPTTTWNWRSSMQTSWGRGSSSAAPAGTNPKPTPARFSKSLTARDRFR